MTISYLSWEGKGDEMSLTKSLLIVVLICSERDLDDILYMCNADPCADTHSYYVDFNYNVNNNELPS